MLTCTCSHLKRLPNAKFQCSGNAIKTNGVLTNLTCLPPCIGRTCSNRTGFSILLRFLNYFRNRSCKHSPSIIKKCAWPNGILTVFAKSSILAGTSGTFRPSNFPSSSATLADAQNSSRSNGFSMLFTKSAILARTDDIC